MSRYPAETSTATTRTMDWQMILAVVALLLSSAGCNQRDPSSEAQPSSALDNIVLARELRCSYLLYSPLIRKDPNTGELSGIFYDIMEEIGRRAELEIAWVEEVEYENIFIGLDANRYDVFCGGLWPSSVRAKVAYFTIPVFYSVITAWVRASEERWDSLEELNDPSVRIATKDGALEDIVARTDYPKAARASLSQGTPFSQNLLNIIANKADVTFAEPGTVFEFLQTNPGTLKQLKPDEPVRVFGNSLVVRRGDIDLKLFLDAAMRELLFSGAIDRILAKYETGPNLFPRVARPYTINQPVAETSP
ncbi:MAG: transporter substrate-binding domain-containing protein [Pseudomonadota bacterium]